MVCDCFVPRNDSLNIYEQTREGVKTLFLNFAKFFSDFSDNSFVREKKMEHR